MANSIDMKVDINQVKKMIKDLSQVRDLVMPDIYKEFVANTPINQNPKAKNRGNARANTTYHSNIIDASYPYASVLNDGRGFRDGQMRGSEQAPQGMVEPTKEFAKKLIPQVVRKIGAR
jgi:hypothetical protein